MAKVRVSCCPFCGSIPRLVSVPGHGGHNDYPPFAYVKCSVCYSHGPIEDAAHSVNYQLDAVNKWNVRKRASSVEIEIRGQED